jgi:hypothetical protein
MIRRSVRELHQNRQLNPPDPAQGPGWQPLEQRSPPSRPTQAIPRVQLRRRRRWHQSVHVQKGVDPLADLALSRQSRDRYGLPESTDPNVVTRRHANWAPTHLYVCDPLANDSLADISDKGLHNGGLHFGEPSPFRSLFDVPIDIAPAVREVAARISQVHHARAIGFLCPEPRQQLDRSDDAKRPRCCRP